MAESSYVSDITVENFEQNVLQASLEAPVLVDFWAPWCGPCQNLGPILEKLADEYAGRFTVAKINTDEQQAIAGQLGIRSLPTVKLVFQGQIVDEFTGLQPESAIRQMLERHVPPAPVPEATPQELAREAIAAGDAAGAMALLQQAITTEPENYALQIELANAHLAAGDPDQAQALIDALPLAERETDAARQVLARLTFAAALAGVKNPDTLAAQVDSDPNDLSARHQLGAWLLINGDMAGALEQFMAIMLKDRSFEDDLGRRSLVDAFAIADDPALVNRYRKQMARVLF